MRLPSQCEDGRHDVCHACVISVFVNWMGKGCILRDIYLDFNFSLGLEVSVFMFGDRSQRQNRSKCSTAPIFYLTAVVCHFLSHVWGVF